MRAVLILLGLLACDSPAPPVEAPVPVEAPAVVQVAIDLDDPASCAPCHGTIAAEWQRSMHSRAHQDNDPIYGAMRSLRIKKQGDQVAGKCAQCHSPRSPADTSTAAAKAGVSCAVCHTAIAIDASHGPGAKALTAGDALLGPHDLAEGASPIHATGAAPAHITDGTTLCMACHDATTAPSGVAACTTGPEHRDADGASCTSCHMPRVDGPNGAVSTRADHASHEFMGPHHAWNHSDSSFLGSAVELSATLKGQRATLTLRNTAGHAVPTGFPGRLMVLMVRGLDDKGVEVWANITDDPSADPAAVFNKVYVNDAGDKVPAAFATSLKRDSRLVAGSTRTLEYDVPATVHTLEARLVLRLLPPPLANKLGLAGATEAEPRIMVMAVTVP